MRLDADIVRAVAVCAELTGTELSEHAMRAFALDLNDHPKPAVLHALERCRRELRGRLTLADVLTRIAEADGRPSADEAWAMMPMSEGATVVWTDEMAKAWGIALPIIASDKVAARMAFKQAYDRAVSEARQANAAPKWRASLGHDTTGRESVIRRAVELGQLTSGQATKLLPNIEIAPDMLQLAKQVVGKADVKALA
jgi:hypothetical protein